MAPSRILTSPVTNGPFGKATDFAGDYTDYFDSLGSYATSLGTWDSNGARACRDRSGSSERGAELSSSSSDANQAFDTSNQKLMLNSTAYGGASVPEPSSLIMGIVGLAMAGGVASAAADPIDRPRRV